MKVVMHNIIGIIYRENYTCENVQACHKLQVQSKNASEICNCWDTQAAAVEVTLMIDLHRG